MKVVKSEEDLLEFDNGLKITGQGEHDCCAVNYLDFEQFTIGTEFPDYTLGELVDAMTVKEDGFALTDVNALPKWAQARSEQNGYYSDCTELSVSDGVKTISLGDLSGEQE